MLSNNFWSTLLSSHVALFWLIALEATIDWKGWLATSFRQLIFDRSRYGKSDSDEGISRKNT